jgi:uncharacterized protein YbdZ (MbtH family)
VEGMSKRYSLWKVCFTVEGVFTVEGMSKRYSLWKVCFTVGGMSKRYSTHDATNS